MDTLKALIDWKLLKGSHEWPGPDGGTCINEAAIVVAGLPYRKVDTASDCPPCFSPVLAAYLIGLNDTLDDTERQRLIPFAVRLSGSADTPAVEQKRANYIALETIRRVVPVALEGAALPDEAAACRRATTATMAACAARAASVAREARAAREAITQTVVEIADGAFAIGRQAAPIEAAIISERVAAIKRERAPV